MVVHVSRWSIPSDILSTLSLRLLFVPGPIETLIISMVSFPRQNIFIAGRSGFMGRLCFGYVMTMGGDVILPLISRIQGQNLKYLILIVRSVDFFLSLPDSISAGCETRFFLRSTARSALSQRVIVLMSCIPISRSLSK